MTDPGYYDQSIPPALLIGGARRVAGSAPAGSAPAGEGSAAPAAARLEAAPPAGDQQPSPLLVTAGDPGQYQPAAKAADRPRNVTELNSAGAVPDPATPWTAGQYVPVGISGKRAHWNGEEWRGGESPGYPATQPATEQPATEQPATEAAPRHAAPEQPPRLPPAPYRTEFPGDEQPGDLSR
jgi:hypothetical protein